jgi:hypothetical protein
MIKNFLSVLIFLSTFFFIFFITSTYFSNNNKEKINENRINVYTKVKDHLPTLPLLENDTQDVIEFNSGYEDHGNKIKRNFWKLFNKK